MALSFYVIVSFLITLQRYIFLLYIQKNEIKNSATINNILQCTTPSADRHKKSTEKTYFFGAFYCSVFWLSHQKSLTLNNKEYIIFGF